jgi:hypothetical protein
MTTGTLSNATCLDAPALASRCVQALQGRCGYCNQLTPRVLVTPAGHAVLLVDTMFISNALLLLLIVHCRLPGWRVSNAAFVCRQASTYRSGFSSVRNLKRYHYGWIQRTTDHCHNTHNLW